MATRQATQQKELKMDFVVMCQRKEELRKRNQKAQSYCAKVERKKQNKKADRTVGIMLVIGLIMLLLSVGIKIKNTEPRYAKADGNCYVYVTEKICEVTEVVQDHIIVSYKGEEYGFYGCGNDYEVGEEIICQFTDGMEIIGVIEY